MKPQKNRPQAFRCPDHGWVTINRLDIKGAHAAIWRVNRVRLEARGVAGEELADETTKVTSHSEADLLAAFWFYKMRPELQKPIGRYFADFCFPTERLVVEVDGRDWHDWKRDLTRDRALRKLGYRTKRFYASEVWRDPMNCAQQVRRELERLRRAQERAA